jgi:ferrous iron transport protein B
VSSPTSSGLPSVVIAGNPNTGKSTVFNQLTGGRARIGNYPGITVERSFGLTRLPGGRMVQVLDSPGTYSLVARSAEEQLAIEALAGLPPMEVPDVAVITVDATQLSRNLYLVLQTIELGVPVIVALNMIDSLEESGQDVDAVALAKALGVPVVPMVARQGKGLANLVSAIVEVLEKPARGRPGWRWRSPDPALAADVAAVAAELPESWHMGDEDRRQAIALWALLSVEPGHELRGLPARLEPVVAERRAMAREAGRDLDREIIQGRYEWIDQRLHHVVRERRHPTEFTDRVDRILLHPALGFILFLGLMTLVFQALFTGADPLIGLIEGGVGWLGNHVGALMGPGIASDFVVNGVIEGVGAFIVFLPQIVMLFLFIGLMEDTGYMARVAVLMDRLMRSVGLHGRAFVPMLSGYACAVPAIMATRTMERRRDRLLTMMALPLMTCSARLPVYGLLIAAIVPPWQKAGFTQGLLMAAMYLFGTVMALVVAWIMSKTMLRGTYIPLVIEMPPYRMPHWPSITRTVMRRAGDFMKTAGTIILICSMGMWVLLSFPKDAELEARHAAEIQQLQVERSAANTEEDQTAIDDRIANLDAQSAAASARHSFAGRLGHAIEPAIEPLGFDWKIGVGIISAFAAREVFVSTMGVVFGVGEDVNEETGDLREKMWFDTWPDGKRVFTPLVCLSLMVFFALACQCMSTLAVVRRETGGWGWPTVMFVYMSILAWIASFLVYQGGLLLGFT